MYLNGCQLLPNSLTKVLAAYTCAQGSLCTKIVSSEFDYSGDSHCRSDYPSTNNICKCQGVYLTLNDLDSIFTLVPTSVAAVVDIWSD